MRNGFLSLSVEAAIDAGSGRAQVAQLGVDVAAGARGVVGVAVAVDDRQADGLARGELVAALRRDLCPALRVAAVHRELPGGQLRQRGEHRAGRLSGLVVADHREAGRGVVEAQGVRAADRLVDPAVPALPDRAVVVDEEVVGEVGPAQAVGVVAVHAADHGGHVCLRVAVARRGVVHVRLEDGAVVARRTVAPALVGAPLRPGVDRGQVDGGAGPQRRPRGRPGGEPLVARQSVGVDQGEVELGWDRSRDPHLDAVGGLDHHGSGAGLADALARARVGHVVQHRGGPPQRPATLDPEPHVDRGAGALRPAR